MGTPGRAVLGTAILLAALLACASSASAVSVTLGPPTLTGFSSGYTCLPPCTNLTLSQTVFATPGSRLSAPADGTVTSWGVLGTPNGGTLHLRVLRPVAGGQFTGAGRSAAASNVAGGPNATGLPIRIGDQIGVDLNANGSLTSVGTSFGPGAIAGWASPGLAEGATVAPNSPATGEIHVNATVELTPPVVSTLTPTSGGPGGGQTVTIEGDHLANATAVSFGGNPATFTNVSNSRVDAVAPEHAAGAVDVAVTTIAGTSSAGAGSTFTYATPPPPLTPPAQASFARSKSSLRVNRRGRFTFTFDATAGLTGRALFRSVKRLRAGKRVTLANKSFTAPDSGRVVLKLKLSKKNLRLLKRKRRIRTRVTVTLQNAAGLTSTAGKTVTLTRPPPR